MCCVTFFLKLSCVIRFLKDARPGDPRLCVLPGIPRSFEPAPQQEKAKKGGKLVGVSEPVMVRGLGEFLRS